MKTLMFASIACSLILLSNVDARASFQDDDDMSRKTPHKTENCRHRYIPEKYVFVGEDRSREVALYRRVNTEPFTTRLMNVMPRVLRFLIFKK